MIEIRAIGADDWRTWRDLRLAALADAPGAFGSRLADWQGATEQRWRDRLAAVDTNLVAYLDGTPAGMASGARDDDNPTVAVLLSMYVAPAARGHGLGDRLIAAIADWAATTGATALHLDVKAGNEPAAALYRRNGFTVSDQPAADPTEITMVRSLADPAHRWTTGRDTSRDGADVEDEHERHAVSDLVDHAVIANSQPPQAGLAGELPAAVRSRIGGEIVDRSAVPPGR